ncbi:hypothetical protein EG328_011490 [Venturia inaequalis]|uniref:Uncharacterized protein n=1 Tax=Venturia inaequalis TaxID=5025 RepID=A0A8H3Z6R5_VENIN|nr:hypothetical protein EG328_011490 [Venturia inaequalis]KAE9991554.1 hypothetical protein EG327_011456 [Venturia inaequalis]RDI77526.1 hypothetical protein Vi05172_g12493 [Venturia inaequalis]
MKIQTFFLLVGTALAVAVAQHGEEKSSEILNVFEKRCAGRGDCCDPQCPKAICCNSICGQVAESGAEGTITYGWRCG